MSKECFRDGGGCRCLQDIYKVNNLDSKFLVIKVKDRVDDLN